MDHDLAPSIIELEIHRQMKALQRADFVADAIIKTFEPEKLSQQDSESLAIFLLNSGFYLTLISFFVRKAADGSQLPWAHMAEALAMIVPEEEEVLKKALIEGAGENLALRHLARCRRLDNVDPEILQVRRKNKIQILEAYEKRRKDFFNQIEVLRSQDLIEEEEKLLLVMERHFPGDAAIRDAKVALNEKKALSFISTRPKHKTPRPPRNFFEALSTEEESILSCIQIQLQEHLRENPRLLPDLVNMHFFWDAYDYSGELLKEFDPQQTLPWLWAETFLRGRHFVELLNLLTFLEEKMLEDPEQVFALHYLRAQALWGLNQKYQAIELMEGLVQVRPHYRAAQAILDDWRDEAQ